MKSNWEHLREIGLGSWIEPIREWVVESQVEPKSAERAMRNLINYLQETGQRIGQFDIIRETHIHNLKGENETFRSWLIKNVKSNHGKNEILFFLQKVYDYQILKAQAEVLTFNYINPIDYKWDKFKVETRSGSIRRALPLKVIEEMKRILIEKNFQWSRDNFKKDYISKILNHETGEVDENVFSLSTTLILYILLTIPLRGMQAQLLDSGEKDEWIYDFKTESMVKNLNGEKGRKEGFIRKVFYSGIRGEEKESLWITTNKSAGCGYEIPWVSSQLVSLIGLQVEFLKKYSPDPIKVDKSSVVGKVSNKKLYDSSGTNPIVAPVEFILDIYAPGGTCLLYEETQTTDLTNTNGQFSLQVGHGMRTSNDHGLSLTNIFANTGSQLVAAGSNCSSGYTSSSGDSRSLRVTILVQGGNPTTLSPDLVFSSVPNALVADSLQGLAPSDLIQNQGTVSQANLQNLTNGSDASPLHNHDSQYVKLGSTPSFSTVTISGSPINPTDATSKSYVDSLIAGLSSTYMTQSSAAAQIAAIQPTSSSVASALSSVMSGDATMSPSGAVTLATQSGLTAGTYSKVTVNSKGLVTSGTAISASDIPAPAGDVTGTYAATKVQSLQGYPVSNTAPTTGQLMQYNGTSWIPTAPAPISSVFNGSLGGSGYEILPGGLIIEWGYTTASNQYTYFPYVFPHTCLQVVGSDTGGANASFGFYNLSNVNMYVSSINSGYGAHYIAVGY